MRVVARVVVVAMTLCTSAACGHGTLHATTAPTPVEADLTAALARAEKEGRPLFVHFTAAWCLPCKELKSSVYPDPAVASRLARFVRAEIDIESPAGEASARRYRVQTVPVLLTLSPQGEEFRSLRIVGAPAPSELAAILDKALEQTK